MVVWVWSVTRCQFFPAGFSVNASSERLNMGEIETLDDYWAPARADWPSLFSLLTMDSAPLDTTLTHHILFITATNHRTNHLRLFLPALCVQDSLNHFCWWASQTVDKWTRPCVLGVAVGITPQQGWFWADVFTVPWFHLLSPRKCVGICQ